MNVVTERRHGVDGFDNVAGKVARMAGGKTHTPDALDLAYGSE